ncbi:E3 ubiquitin-protein ligase TRIM39-like [Neoarius graeffei]|uniref:E3 ubiquitin-protein ligase TRIM39-like n=1 Tax=Neoarius graeffei TaxID=443677 RepID=UPI00298C43F6|nr:E3 ubiquitin-protein ligase TRIM39-like [Neoarius graeffei]
MASSSSLLCEDQLQCSICLEAFTDPVTTPCGHNFCMICLTEFWDSSSQCQCPACKTNFAERPEICVNTSISALDAPFKKAVQVKSSSAAENPTQSVVLCDICCEKKLVAVKSCLICMTSYCKTHLERHERVSSLKKHKLMDPVENLEYYICQKHERPLELFCRDEQTCVCQFCTETNHNTHNTVSIKEESEDKKTELGKIQTEVQQMTQERVKRIEEIKDTVELNKKNTEKEKADVMETFSALMCCIEKSQTELLKMMKEKQKTAWMQAEEFIKELEQEITELKRRNTELEQLSRTEDHLYFLQIYPSLCSPPHTQDWTDIIIDPHLSEETLRRALSQLQETLMDVNLDPDRVSPYCHDPEATAKSSSTAKEPTQSLVPCDVCSEKKRAAVKTCLICMTSYCKIHLELHERVSLLKKHKLVDPVENLEEYICLKHERPLELYCRDDQMCVCQFCLEGEHKTHDTVHIEKESGEKKTELRKAQVEVQQMIQERVKKIEEIKHAVELNKKNTEKEKADIVEIFSVLMRCIERSETELLKVMEEKQKAAERQAEVLIKKLEQEITELKRRNTELEQLSCTEDHLHFLQIYPSMCSPPHIQDWTDDVTINAHLSLETLRRALSQLQETFSKEIQKAEEIELKRIQQYAVDVTLDPDTAHPKLMLSDDGKQVKHGNNNQTVPDDNPERFNHCICVLGKEGFSSGRFYYEVQVRGKTAWDLGVAKESINRKGEITASHENGYWCVCLRTETKYQAWDSPPVSLSMKQIPQKVGVFVDYEEGLISFYDVDAKSHIYSFTGQNFTEKLYPYFCPCHNDGGKNSAPLVICQRNHICEPGMTMTE